MKTICCLVLASAGCFFEPAAGAQAQPPRLPEGPGLAAKYPGDAGIATDPGVILVEDFEDQAWAQTQKRWENVSRPEIMSFSADVPPASKGKQSLLMTHVGGQGTGGHLYRRLQPGHDKLHVRFYVKFDAHCAPIHHFLHVGGYHPPTPFPQGGAGQRPRGQERFSTGVEPFGNAWRWDYYSYWMEMRGSPPRGQTWGNSFIHNPTLKVERGQWQCLELMMRMNDAGNSNGEQALWLDGKLVSHLGQGFPRGKWVYDRFLPGQGGEGIGWNDAKGSPERLAFPAAGLPFDGFRWRQGEQLKLNFLWVLLYITRAPPDHVSRIWFDHIVVSKTYVGPIQK